MIDFTIQSNSSKLNELNDEISSYEQKLNKLKMNEAMQNSQLIRLKDENERTFKNHQEKLKRTEDELLKKVEQLELKKSTLAAETDEMKKWMQLTKNEAAAINEQINANTKKLNSLTNLKNSKELELNSTNKELTSLQANLDKLKAEYTEIIKEKQKSDIELSANRSKILNLENEIHEKSTQAKIEIEKFKRDERASIELERKVIFSKLEVKKESERKEIELEHMKKLDEINHLKLSIDQEVGAILKNAREIEQNITTKASERLAEVTEMAKKREEESFKLLREAQTVLKNREFEQDEKLKADFEKKKRNLKSFLAEKHATGLANIKKLETIALEKNKKILQRGLEEVENLKRNELKKLAIIREKETTELHQLVARTREDLNREKSETIAQIERQKETQNSELEEKRKSVIEHINLMQLEANEKAELQRKNIELEFERSKKALINSASNALLTTLKFDLNVVELPENAKEKIESALTLSLGGVNTEAHQKVTQILEFNPKSYKEIAPVLRKYSLRALPLAIAFAIMVDLFSTNSFLIGQFNHLNVQRKMASDQLAKQQKDEWKMQNSYNPVTTANYKDNYTDNILYTTNFMQIMEDQEFQNSWILKLHDFMTKNLELSEDLAIHYISLESSILKEVGDARRELNPQNLKAGLDKMRLIETNYLKDFYADLTKASKLEKFNNFKKAFYDEFVTKKAATPATPVATPTP